MRVGFLGAATIPTAFYATRYLLFSDDDLPIYQAATTPLTLLILLFVLVYGVGIVLVRPPTMTFVQGYLRHKKVEIVHNKQ